MNILGRDELSFLPLGGIGDVTRNMYLYEYKGQVLIVDCGLGFADETMLGVDLLLPDISHLLQARKNIVGMALTHGHEDHIGALPYVLPQLPQFPIYGSPFTAALANDKLTEFRTGRKITPVPFDNREIQLGPFSISFHRVTHSVPDTTHVFIKTPVGNFYHGSDYKFDDTPADGKKTDYPSIEKKSQNGVLCLLSDCLGAEKMGRVPTEVRLIDSFKREMETCNGKFIITTYSSNVARLNQIIEVSEKLGRNVCFVGRSLIKNKEVAQKLGYLKMNPRTEVEIDHIKNHNDNKLTLIVAGAQGQENSALSRIANNEHREIKLSPHDTVIFSADPIPGNEVTVYELIDTLTKKGVRVIYSALSKDFHVSGHGSLEELAQLIRLTRPKTLLPIGGAFRHMAAYRNLAVQLGYKKSDVLLLEDGQEILFSKNGARLGKFIPTKKVYVDEISGEEVESFVLRDRQKLSEGGIVIILAEIDSANGQLVENPDIIIRGFASDRETKTITNKLSQDLKTALKGRSGRVINWMHIRKLIGEVAERRIFKDLKRRPLVLPVVIEV